IAPRATAWSQPATRGSKRAIRGPCTTKTYCFVRSPAAEPGTYSRCAHVRPDAAARPSREWGMTSRPGRLPWFDRSAVRGHQAHPRGFQGRFGAAVDLELAIDVLQVVGHRVPADLQPLGQLGQPAALADQYQYL